MKNIIILTITLLINSICFAKSEHPLVNYKQMNKNSYTHHEKLEIKKPTKKILVLESKTNYKQFKQNKSYQYIDDNLNISLKNKSYKNQF